MAYNVQYRLLSIEFRGMKPRAMFNGAVIEHRADYALLSNLRTPAAKVQEYLDEINGREARSIRYQIIATDPRTGRRAHPPITFCHDFPRGTGVRLIPAPTGLLMVRDKRRRFFSNGFELGGVTENRIDSTQRVYQFHE